MTERMAAPVVATDARMAAQGLITALRQHGFTVIGPRRRGDVIALDEVRAVDDLPVGWTDEQEAATYRVVAGDGRSLFGYALGPQSPRRYLSPPRRTLWTGERIGLDFVIRTREPDPPSYAFLGIRACELAAIDVQDRVLRDGRHPDPDYSAARERAFFVGVNCAAPAPTCFCASMDTGPEVRRGHDLVLTELLEGGRHELLMEAATERGAAVLDAALDGVPWRAAEPRDVQAVHDIVAATAARMTRRLDPETARDTLAANLHHPQWDDVADRCLSCTNCTLVCPTCFCSSVEDVTSIDGERTERSERWDSCFTLGHSTLHGMGSVRADVRSRYRQWLTHKLSTWWDQFGTSGCVGCGRCITWCPAAIDLTAEVAAMSGPVAP
jgi:formate hydrogenlyase subunit 6/NADH:ubiquinone oxidoreductase subunit I